MRRIEVSVGVVRVSARRRVRRRDTYDCSVAVWVASACRRGWAAWRPRLPRFTVNQSLPTLRPHFEPVRRESDFANLTLAYRNAAISGHRATSSEGDGPPSLGSGGFPLFRVGSAGSMPRIGGAGGCRLEVPAGERGARVGWGRGCRRMTPWGGPKF
eukprot:1577173-Prymnesium_polylepis.1